MNGKPSTKHPDPVPATRGQVYEARQKPKKRKIIEAPENVDCIVDIQPTDQHLNDLDDCKNEKNTQTEENGKFTLYKVSFYFCKYRIANSL